MKVTHNTVNTIQEENFMRSTIDPSTRATVMQAKVIWNSANTLAGMVPLQARPG